MDISTCLIEHNDGTKTLNASGIVFDKKWAIFPASIFLVNLSEIPEYILNMPSGQLISKNYFKINDKNTKIILSSQNTDPFVKYLNFYACFSCKNLRSTQNFPLVPLDLENYRQVTFILSLFIIVTLNVENNCDLSSSLKYLLQNSKSVVRGRKIFVESTPFGSEDLICTLTKGIVANTFGKNGSYFLIDAATAPGSEGGAIFLHNDNNRSVHLCGIVISSMTTWRGEQTSLTLGAAIVPLLSQIFNEQSQSYESHTKKSSILDCIDSSLAQIFSGGDWGTAILINKKNAVFLTAAHVVPKPPSEVKLKWKNEQFPGYVRFKTDKNSPFDIAVVQTLPDKIRNMSEVKISSKILQKGDAVIAAGFPIFQSTEPILPTLCHGNVSLCKKSVMHTTCTVLSGSSGGAMINTSGELVGVIICHTIVPVNGNNIVYPKINMSIPIQAVWDPIQKYLRNGNVQSLKKLNEESVEVVNDWRLYKAKL